MVNSHVSRPVLDRDAGHFHASRTPSAPTSTRSMVATSSPREPLREVAAAIDFGSQLTGLGLGPVDQPDAMEVDLGALVVTDDARRRVDAQQLAEPAGEARLFPQLADRGGFGVLAELDAATGQRPRAGTRRDLGEARQQQPVVLVEAHDVGRDALDARRAHVPSKRASRFSLNAAIPSTRSGDDVASAWKWPSSSSESASPCSNDAFSSRFDRPSDRVGPAARRSASAGRGAEQRARVVDALVREAELDRFGTGRGLAEHHHRLGPRHADEAGEQVRAARVDDEPPLGERPHEARLRVHQHEVAHEREVRAGPDRGAVDRGDGRLVELPQLADERLHARPQRLGRRPGREAGLPRLRDGRRAEVHARAERVAGTGDEHRADGGVGTKRAHRVDDAVAHLDRERVRARPAGPARSGRRRCPWFPPAASAVRSVLVGREDVHDGHTRAAAAGVVLQCEAVAHLDLAFARVAAQLPPALGELPRPRSRRSGDPWRAGRPRC